MTASIVTVGGKLNTIGGALAIVGAQWDIPKTGITWPNAPNITWAWATTSSTTLATITNAVTDTTQQAQITAGIMLWTQVSGLKLTQVQDPTTANIQIGWADCGSIGLIGQARWNYTGTTYTAALVILEDPALSALSSDGNGLLAYSDNVELRQLACHEFGATLGLAEGNVDPTSIMNHVLDSSNRVPDYSDVAAMQSLYGPPN